MSNDAPLRSPAASADHAPPRLSAAEIIALLSAELDRLDRLDHLDGKGGSILATDADGTLWDGDVAVDIFEALIAIEGVREAAQDALAADVEEIGLTARGKSPTALARSLYAAYAADRYPYGRVFAMMTWAFAGWHEDEVHAFAQRVLDDSRIEARIRPEMQRILAWAEARKVQVVVVSASPIAIVEAGAARLGAPVARSFAMTPAIGADRLLLPRLDGLLVYGEGKVRALADAGITAPLLAAFGDSHHDAPMLRISRIPVAFTPSQRMLEIASTIAGLVELQRGGER
jgi:phosphatidylglycerophosphatase C